MTGPGPSPWARRRRRLALVARLTVLLAAAAAAAGFVVMDARLGGLGYAIVLVPVALVVSALGLLGAQLVGAPGRTRLVLALGAVLVLLLVAVGGLSPAPLEPA